MPDRQRIFVVSAPLDDAGLARLRGLGRDPVVLTAPTPEAARVVRALAAEPHVDALLAPVSHPHVDRGHRLDELVRRHALRDRFRDVVVVTDRASATLLLRVLAPDQLADQGQVVVVGLARGGRPVAVRRAVVAGLVLGGIAYVADPVVWILVLPFLVAVAGAVLLLPRQARHIGQALLLAAGIGLLVALAIVAGSARFPAG
ncbi:hypothetical protein [Nocardioides pyridinolyticus]